MHIVIIANPKQAGATDGAIGIAHHVIVQYEMDEKKNGDIAILRPRSDDLSPASIDTPPDIIIGVGPDYRDEVLAMYNHTKNQGHDPMLINMKDPMYDLPDRDVDDYAPWDVIIDTMNTLAGEDLDLSDILITPAVPPFSLTTDRIRRAVNSHKENTWANDNLAVYAIGGPTVCCSRSPTAPSCS